MNTVSKKELIAYEERMELLNILNSAVSVLPEDKPDLLDDIYDFTGFITLLKSNKNITIEYASNEFKKIVKIVINSR